MDAPSPQPWGIGLRARMKTPPPSFVVFFPARHHSASPAICGTTAQCLTGNTQSDASWNNDLAAPRPISRLPAWHRVPVEAFPGRNGVESTRIIMKRIFQPTRRRFAKKSSLLDECTQVSAAEETAADPWTVMDILELPEAKNRKLESFKASDALYKSSGAPLSAAEMAHIFLTAKVDIVNAMLQIPRSVLKEEVEALRSLKVTRGVTPMKRSIDKNNCIERHGLYGGYRIESYDQLMPIILKATESGDIPVDILSASIAEISANFTRTGRPNPRSRVSLQGIPHLSDIIDRPELKNEVSLLLPCGESTIDHKSPVKKSSQPIQPLETTPRRLSDTVVKLAPVVSPAVEPSPIKSPVTPSTPFINTPSRLVSDETPSRLGDGVMPPSLAPSPKKTASASPGPTLTFQAPLYEDSSSTNLCQSLDDPSPRKAAQPESPIDLAKTPQVTPGPTRISRAPSYEDCSSAGLHQSMNKRPSQCKIAQSATHIDVSDIPGSQSAMEAHVAAADSAPAVSSLQQGNACKSDPVLGLVSSIPAAATPKQKLPSFHPAWPSDISQIDFGPITPSFDSSNWLGDPVTTRYKKITKSMNRRRSEPQLRKHYSKQATHRRTMSPNHLVFQGDLIFDTPKASRPETAGEVEHRSCQSDVKSDSVGPVRTPEQLASEPNLNFVTPAISWGEMTGRVSGDGVSPLRDWAAPPSGVHNVDIRQHLDIFGASATSTARSSSAVDVLAGMARDHCDGQANVTVIEENGRLVVRFKLPIEFAHLFPGNQGEDRSCFTMTPSMSSSPRINFAGHGLDDDVHDEPSAKEQPSSPAWQQGEEEDHTLVMSDFPMPDAASDHESTNDYPPQLNHTHVIGHLSTAASPAQLKPTSPWGQAEPVPAADNTEARVASRTPSPTLNLSFTPVNLSSPRCLSPDMVANHETPEMIFDQEKPAQQEETITEPKFFDDSPGRDYMRDFIKRTSRKRLSATEAGSPVAFKRLPLEAISPNTPSPQKTKRKAECDPQSFGPDSKPIPGPVPKKARQADQLGAHEPSESTETKDRANKGKTGKASLHPEAAAHVAKAADDQEDKAEMTTGNGAGTRRSTRIRSQKPIPGATSKSSIPTAIKLGSRSGAGRGGLNLATRTEQQDLSHQTRVNTRRNRGNAEPPSQVLARYQGEGSCEGSSEESSESELVGKPSTGGKNVGWKTPLEAHEDEKPKRARTASSHKSKASGIAKSTKTATTAQRQQRAAKVAATLGMSQNGTPAKPNRVTRSSTRVQRA